MTPSRPDRHVIRFGVFEVDLAAGELRKSGVKIKIQEQPFQLLKALLEQPGEVVTREQLRERLWPEDTFVDFDRSLNTAASRLREALGDSASNPRFVETLPRRGYRFIAPVDGAADQAEQAEAPSQRKRLWLVAGALGVAAIAIVVWHSLNGRETATAGPLQPVPFTTDPRCEYSPAFSPDGGRVAFTAETEEEGNFDIYVKQVNGAGLQRLTTDPAFDMGPTWSPDGSQIAFRRRTRSSPTDEFEILEIPSIGGPERKIADVSSSWYGRPLSFTLRGQVWSPDGKFLVLTHQGSPDAPHRLYLESLESGTRTPLSPYPPPGSWGAASNPALSPDGRWVAFVWWEGQTLDQDIFLLSLSSVGLPQGDPRRLTHGAGSIYGLDWTSDSGSLIFSSDRAGSEQLWRVPVSGGEPELLELGGDRAYSPAVSRQGNRLAYVREMEITNIWRTAGPLSARRGDSPEKAAPSPVITSTREDGFPSYSPDGSKIAFASNRSGGYEVWISNGDGSDQVQLTRLNGVTGALPQWSPDGRLIAFDVDPDGQKDIYVVASAGGVPRPLTTGRSHDCNPSWSADGQWVYYLSNQDGAFRIWKTPVGGGPSVALTEQGRHGQNAMESPDGRYLYHCRGPSFAEPGIWRAPVEGGDWTQVVDHCRYFSWAVIQDGIFLIDRPGRDRFMEFYSFETGRLERVGVLPPGDPYTWGTAVSPDGQWLLFTKTQFTMTDIMLVENFR